MGELQKRIEKKKKYLRATKELYRNGFLDALDDFTEWIEEMIKDCPKSDDYIPENFMNKVEVFDRFIALQAELKWFRIKWLL